MPSSQDFPGMGSYTLPGGAWYSVDKLFHLVISDMFVMTGNMVDKMGHPNYMA